MVRRRVGTAILVVSALLLGGAISAPAAKPKPKAKPPAHAVLGTTQLEGEPGIMGKTYTLGKDSPWNITVDRAEYSVGHLQIGDRLWVPNSSQKMLVLHYTVHNPQKGEALMRFDTLRVTAVDVNNTNWESVGDIGAEGSEQAVSVQMKPAQKMAVYTAVMVPAAGPAPKVIFKSSDDRVVRYYPDQVVKGKNVFPVKPLEAPFSDPADASGKTALSKVPGAMGVYYPMVDTDLKVESAALSDKPIKDRDLEEGQHFLIVTVTAKGVNTNRPVLRFDTYQAKVTDADGMDTEFRGEILAASRDTDVDTNLEIGQEVRFRFCFAVPKDAVLKTLSVGQDECRTYQFDLSGVK